MFAYTNILFRSSIISSNSSLNGLQRRTNLPISSAQSGLTHLNTGSATQFNSSVHSSNLNSSVLNSNSFNHQSLSQEHSDGHKRISGSSIYSRPSNTSLPSPSNTSLPRSSNISIPRASNTSLPCPSNTSLPRPSNTFLPMNVSSPNLTRPPSDQETSTVREEIGNVSLQPKTGKFLKGIERDS